MGALFKLLRVGICSKFLFLCLKLQVVNWYTLGSFKHSIFVLGAIFLGNKQKVFDDK